MSKTILLVDDDPHILDVVSFALKKANFAVVEAHNGLQALSLFEQQAADLILLDIGLPELDGMEVCKQIRHQDALIPIFFLTAHDEEIDRVLGLELGADDYICKPFSPRELVARIKAIFRRINNAALTAKSNNQTILSHGLLQLDCNSYQISWDGQFIDLTATEFLLLKILLQHPGQVFTRNMLMEQAYSPNIIVSDRTIDSHLRRIRKKFQSVDAQPVSTVHGVGYKLNNCQRNS